MQKNIKAHSQYENQKKMQNQKKQNFTSSQSLQKNNLQHQNQQPSVQNLQKFEHQNHMNIVEGINDVHQLQNYNCQWIQGQQSPHKIVNQSFPSDIQIRLDGVNVGSSHFLQEKTVNPNDLSINNEPYYDDNYFNANQNNNNLNEKSYTSDIQQNVTHDGHALNDQLILLNNSKQADKSWLKLSRQKYDGLFDVQNKIISQIQINQELSSIQKHENSHNQISNIEPEQSSQITKNSKILENQQFSSGNAQQIQQIPGNNDKPSIQKTNSQIKQYKSLNISKSQSQQKQNTITINQQSFASKIYEDLNSIQQSSLLKTMASFANTNQQVYRPFYKNLQFIYTNSKSKSDKSLQSFYMYADFFKQKAKQFQKYLRQVQSQKNQKLYQQLQKKEINNLVYVDSKIVLRDMHEKRVKKAKLNRQFYKQIVEMSIQLRKMVTQINQKRSASQKSIMSSLLFVKQIQQQLQKLIQYRVNYQKHRQDPSFYINVKQLFKVDNPHILKDHYLQIRYIIQKQNLYLSKLKSLKVKIMKYLTQVYLIDETVVGSKIKQYLINYTEMLIEVQRQESILSNGGEQPADSFVQNKTLIALRGKKQNLQKKKIHQVLKIQSYKKLLQCVPEVLKQQIGVYQNLPTENVQQLLEQLNCYFQNQVFMTCIQMDKQFIFHKSQGIWYSRQQYKAATSQQNPSSQNHIYNPLRNKLNVILSVNKYLHMQQNQKIATLKLNEIKISKKNRFIIINDRGKGIVGFLVNNGNELGRIQMNSVEDADIFASKIKELIEGK